jgi:ubiquinone/menaquinone biosynthesis C-methylase UbiE
MIKGAAEFTRFEHEGWERVADKYDSVWSSLTRQFIPHLIDTVGVSTGMSVLDVACGPGYVSAAIKELASIFPEKWLRSREASFVKPLFAKEMHNSCHL